MGNLKPIKPGEVRNPKGKKPGTLNRSTIVRRWLEVADTTGLTEADKLVLAVLAKGKKNGDVAAMKELLDSGYGKVVDKTAFTDENGEPLNVKISFGK